MTVSLVVGCATLSIYFCGTSWGKTECTYGLCDRFNQEKNSVLVLSGKPHLSPPPPLHTNYDYVDVDDLFGSYGTRTLNVAMDVCESRHLLQRYPLQFRTEFIPNVYGSFFVRPSKFSLFSSFFRCCPRLLLCQDLNSDLFTFCAVISNRL